MSDPTHLRPLSIEVFEGDRVAGVNLLAAYSNVLPSTSRQLRSIYQMTDGVSNQLTLIQIMRVFVKEVLNVFLHFVGDFDIKCAHCVTQVVSSKDKVVLLAAPVTGRCLGVGPSCAAGRLDEEGRSSQVAVASATTTDTHGPTPGTAA